MVHKRRLNKMQRDAKWWRWLREIRGTQGSANPSQARKFGIPVLMMPETRTELKNSRTPPKFFFGEGRNFFNAEKVCKIKSLRMQIFKAFSGKPDSNSDRYAVSP